MIYKFPIFISRLQFLNVKIIQVTHSISHIDKNGYMIQSLDNPKLAYILFYPVHELIRIQKEKIFFQHTGTSRKDEA